MAPVTGQRGRTEVVVDGRHLALSNLDKVLYPDDGFTKAGVIDYYRRVAPALLPHLRGRALTLRRFPDGVDRESFFEKSCPEHRPPWVRTARLPRRAGGDGETIDHCAVEDLPTLVWLANLAALELHVPMARAREPERPTMVVFDLDPGSPAGLPECLEIAVRLRAVLEGLGLASLAKTSGQKGLHVYVPLNLEDGPTHAEARHFAHAVAELVARRTGDGVITRMDRRLREGRVFIDWSQNSWHKTTIAAYSLRPTPIPCASTPLTWDEIESARGREADGVLGFSVRDTLRRLDEHGDLFAPVLELHQRLPEVAGR